MTLLPEVRTASTLLNVSLQRFVASRRKLVAFAAIVVVLSAVGSGLFARAYLLVLHRGFRDRSLAYVQAFAAASVSWVAAEDVAMLRSAGQLLLAGSARFVQIADGTTILVDERTAAAERLELELREGVESFSLEAGEDDTYLDVLVPLPRSAGADGPQAFGYVRVGIDRASVLAESSGAIAGTVGAALGFNVILIGLLAVAFRRPGRSETDEEDRRADRLVRSGRLEIDVGRKSVRLDETPVRLTPKQFTLLELLASDPGRVFAEREILEAAWPDSPYADAKDIKQYVYLVRQRLSAVDPDARNLIETVPGFGYRLAVEDVDPGLT